MSTTTNPAAPHHLPMFITAPGETDVWFNVMVIFLVLAVLMVMVFYFKLHSLPERIAHKGQKVQFELVAILALISLFTHNHIFWIAGLLLAFIPFPDFSTPLAGMNASLARIAGWGKQADKPDSAGTSMADELVGTAATAIAGNGAQVPAPVHGSAVTQVVGSPFPSAETSLNGMSETRRSPLEDNLGGMQPNAPKAEA